jgi:hypothetical protein
MSRIVIVILIYHRHKSIEFIRKKVHIRKNYYKLEPRYLSHNSV